MPSCGKTCCGVPASCLYGRGSEMVCMWRYGQPRCEPVVHPGGGTTRDHNNPNITGHASPHGTNIHPFGLHKTCPISPCLRR